MVRRGSLALDREGDDVAAPDVDELSGAPAVAAVHEEVADAQEPDRAGWPEMVVIT